MNTGTSNIAQVGSIIKQNKNKDNEFFAITEKQYYENKWVDLEWYNEATSLNSYTVNTSTRFPQQASQNLGPTNVPVNIDQSSMT